jgi:excinuclease UvrABC nuclease subunit
MKKHSKSPEELVHLANAFYDQILMQLPFAVKCCDLFESHEIRTNKTTAKIHQNTYETILSIFKKEDYFEKVKIACVQSQLDLLKSPTDKIQGVYIFSKNNQPIYIGISRDVLDRVKQHFYGKTHFSASLAYRITKEEFGHDGARKDLDFSESQLNMQTQFKINVVPVADPYELYWLEVTLAGMFGTKYNEFETH